VEASVVGVSDAAAAPPLLPGDRLDGLGRSPLSKDWARPTYWSARPLCVDTASFKFSHGPTHPTFSYWDFFFLKRAELKFLRKR
jgi:hypothetical protein